MDQLKEYYKELGVSGEVYDYAKNIESSLSERFAEFDAVAEFNQLKVLKAMKKNRISGRCSPLWARETIPAGTGG